jgi:hypothetical protein
MMRQAPAGSLPLRAEVTASNGYAHNERLQTPCRRQPLHADLGVTKSHSRPYTANHNPFSESCFKTLKYQPQFPKRFGCIEDVKTFCRYFCFFDWYNRDDHHAGIGLMTPDQVHYGQADEVHAARQKILDLAYAANPERFVKKPPNPPLNSNQPKSGSIRP